MTRSRPIRRMLALVACAAAATGGLIEISGVARDLENDTVDARFAVRGDRAAPDDLLVVAIDDVTFEDLGEQWPFPRRLHARVIDRLRIAGARVIAYDVQFTEATTVEDDNALIEAIGRAPRVALAATEFNEFGESLVLGGVENQRAVGAQVGDATVRVDRAGVVRKIPFAAPGAEPFSVVAARLGDSTRGDGPTPRGDGRWIDFVGGAGSIRTVSFSRVLAGEVPASAIRGRTVVVGAAAPSLQDVHPTSTTDDGLMAGPEVQANAIHAAMRGFPLEDVPGPVALLLVVVLSVVGPLVARWRGTLVTAAAGVAVGAAYAVVAQIAFVQGMIVPIVGPVAGLLVGLVGAALVHDTARSFDRERMRDAFRRFVPEAIVDSVLEDADGARLGGRQHDVTAVFVDLRGFTTFSETRTPKEVIVVLNGYLEAMTEAVLAHGGTVTSYLGDGLLAVFGAPIPSDDHAVRAVEGALDVLERTAALNRRRAATGEAPFRLGIGIHSGPAMLGNVGAAERLEYTAIGDAINTASRLEGLTKDQPYQLLLSVVTRERLGDAWSDDLVPVGALTLRGRRQPLVAFSLRRTRWEPTPDETEREAARPDEEPEPVA